MVEGLESIVVTVSGYHGLERMKLIKLISVAGANYVGRMSRSTTHLVCWEFKGKKYEFAKKFGILIVNHQWLIDCIKEGKRIPESPYKLQSGQKLGFDIHSLPVLTENAAMLSENELVLNKTNIQDCLNDVVDLVSDEIENDDWDSELLRDENSCPVPRSRKAAPRSYKRKLVKGCLEADRPSKAHTKLAIHEAERPPVDGLQRRRDNDLSSWTEFAETSRRSRRLVKKNANRKMAEIHNIAGEQQSRTHADVNEHTVASSLPDDLCFEIEASTSRRLETAFAVHGQSRDEVNLMNDLGPLIEPSLHHNDALDSNERKTEDISPDVQNSNEDKLGGDESKVDASAELSCVICWTEFSSVRGVLPCGHRFCLTCIQNWADRMASNRMECTCPLCKASFASITRIDAAACLDQKIYSQTVPCASSSDNIVIVPEGRAFGSDIEMTLPLVCCRCQGLEPADLLIPCGTCQRSRIHFYCLDPPTFPWTCDHCRDHRFYF